MTFDNKQIYLACGHTDMRKSINGLSAIVELSFKLDPFAAALFVFCNRNRDRIKILEWDGDGFWLYFKRLEKGRFRWPPADANEVTMSLNGEEFSHLLGSPKVVQKLMRKELKINPPSETLNAQELETEHVLAALRSRASETPQRLDPPRLNSARF